MATEIGSIYWLDLRQETAKVAIMTLSLDLLHRRLSPGSGKLPIPTG
jgi:hypothetical protein